MMYSIDLYFTGIEVIRECVLCSMQSWPCCQASPQSDQSFRPITSFISSGSTSRHGVKRWISLEKKEPTKSHQFPYSCSHIVLCSSIIFGNTTVTTSQVIS